MSDVWTRLTDIAAHLAHDTDVVVAVEEIVFVLPPAGPATRAVRRLVCLKGGIAEHDNQALRVLVVGGDWLVLLSYKLWQLRWWHGLGSCRWGDQVSMRHVGWARASVAAEVLGLDNYILARFLPRSGESRDDVLSWEASALRGPAIVGMGTDDGVICSRAY